MRRCAAGLAALLLIAPTGTSAQQSRIGSDPAVIVVTAAGSVELPADYAVVMLGVEVRDSLAAMAASEMDRRLVAVGDTLAALGFPWDSMPSAGFAVAPEPRYGRDTSDEPRFTASSSVRVTVRDLDRLPEVVMGALAAGANSVSRLEFRSSSASEAHLQALARAVETARDDAERLAETAGVDLGEIREIRTGAGVRTAYAEEAIALNRVVVRGFSAASAAITPRQITVRATVQMTWAIMPR